MSSPVISYDPSRHPALKKNGFLGKGSYGVVYLAYFEGHENAKFAMKSAKYGKKEACMLAKEKRVYVNLKGCPGITRYFMDATTEDPKDGLTYYSLLLEYAPMGSLEELMERKGHGFPERHVKEYARKILVGLCSMHSKGYVHCDLKPTNILAFLSPEGPDTPYDLKLADFGLADEPPDELSMECNLCGQLGTLSYMSPESLKGGYISWRLDIWSFRCVILQMLNGWESPWPRPRPRPSDDTNSREVEDRRSSCPTPPSDEKIGWEVEDRVMDPDFDPFASIPQSMSETGKSFLRKCLDKDPLKRWSAKLLLDHPYVAVAASNALQNDTLSSEISSLRL